MTNVWQKYIFWTANSYFNIYNTSATIAIANIDHKKIKINKVVCS